MKPGQRKDGFTMPEVLVALLIVSGLMLGAVDTLRAFEGARARSIEARRALSERRAVEAALSRLSLSALDGDAAMSSGLADAVTLPHTQATRALRRVESPSGIHAWIIGDGERPLWTAPVRIDAPTPCVFDLVARECRR